MYNSIGSQIEGQPATKRSIREDMYQGLYQHNVYQTSCVSKHMCSVIWIFSWIIIIVGVASIYAFYYPTVDVHKYEAGSCTVIAIETQDCSTWFGVSGKYYVYTMVGHFKHGCTEENSGLCIYDDSNGYVDCEMWGDYEIGDQRQCYIKYTNDKCAECYCDYCSDNSRGSKTPFVFNVKAAILSAIVISSLCLIIGGPCIWCNEKKY
eukprot:248409_1